MEQYEDWLKNLKTKEDVEQSISDIMDILGERYSQVYVIDRETQHIHMLRHRFETVDIEKVRVQGRSYETAILEYIEGDVLVEDRIKMKTLTSFSELCRRLEKERRFGVHYREKVKGVLHHNYLQFARIGDAENFQAVIAAFANEDMDLRRNKQVVKRAEKENSVKRKLLIVEDNEMNAEILAEMLSDEYDVLSAPDGEKGLSLLSEYSHELAAVLLDVYMPVCNGFEFLERQRDDHLLSTIPVIMMTGSDVYEDEVKCLELGATDFIRKPYNASVIKSRLKSIIRLREVSATLADVETDEMTGVYTRSAFYHHAQILLDTKKEKMHVFAADVHHFKLINSIYGERMGDKILIYLAESFRKLFRTGLVARYGSDQFIGITYDEVNFSKESMQRTVKKILDGAPIENLTLNYGIYRDIDKSLSLTQICDCAFTAMKSVQHDPENRVAFYNEEMTRQQMQEQMMENAFDEAIANQEFFVVYQPKYDVHTEKIVGAEALVRWKRKDGTTIWPNQFIPLFERNGMIQRLDQYVFRAVCQVQKDHMDKGETLVPISINLSRATLHAEETVENYVKIVKELNIPFSSVPIELTETAALQSIEIKGLTEKLFQMGFTLHMDDFGTGYSSITSLNILPFEVLKLDKSLTDFISHYRGEQILKHIIALGHGLNMKVLCEGVETKEQVEFLRENGCDEIQGYYYSRPQMYDDFCRMVKESFEG